MHLKIKFLVFKCFWCGPFLKSLLNLFQYCFCCVYSRFWPRGMWDLSSLAKDWTPYTGRWRLNHLTTNEVPKIKFLMLFSNLILKKKKSRKGKNSINLIFIKVSAHPWLSYPWSICWRSHKSTSRKGLTQFHICDRSQVFIIAFESYIQKEWKTVTGPQGRGAWMRNVVFPQGKGKLMRKVIWKFHRVLTSCAKLTVFSTGN